MQLLSIEGFQQYTEHVTGHLNAEITHTSGDFNARIAEITGDFNDGSDTC